MKKVSTAIVVAAFVVSTGLFFGCGDQKDKKGTEKPAASAPSVVAPTDVKENAKAVGEKLNAMMTEQKGEYEHKLQAILNYYDTKIKELDAKVASMTGESKAALVKEIQSLKQQEKELSGKLTALKSDSGAAWEDIQKGLDDSVDNLKKAYSKTASHIQ